ncbi:MAG: T9SS type A sorting domain-containing protein [Elusimicrobia bacterium]|nr:T9SS type A sorting domain-containing protein [Elusimicrobiota bacterium]
MLILNNGNPIGTHYLVEKCINGKDFLPVHLGPDLNIAMEILENGTSPFFVRAKAKNDVGVFSLYSPIVQIDLMVNPPNEVRIYPVPIRTGRGENRLTIEHVSPGTEVKIYTSNGKIVRSIIATSNRSEWDLTNDTGEPVGSGVYFVLLDGSGEKKTFKVVIQR